jgi:dihydrofolate reductase
LDGYSFDPGTEIYRLLAEIDDPQQDEYFVGRLRKAGTHIMGRVTYEEMAQAWPRSDHPFARRRRSVRCSSTSRAAASAALTCICCPPA